MRRPILLAAGSILLLAFGRAAGDELDDRLDRQCRDYPLIVLGRVSRVASTTHPRPPGPRTVAKATVEVRRFLKGRADGREFEAEFRFPSYLELKPDTEDVIWFVRRTPDGKGYLVTDWRWGRDSLHSIQAAVYRLDKTTRLAGMPAAPPGDGPVAVSLGVEDGEGRVAEFGRAASVREVRLLVQFENRGKAELAVMPALDGSDTHRRYPHYDLEVVGGDGKPVPRQSFGVCGNIDPLRLRDVVPLRPGEVFKTWAPWPVWDLPPGRYRVRLRYTARRDTTADGIRLGRDEVGVGQAIQGVWEGTIQSNWAEVEILPKGRGRGE